MVVYENVHISHDQPPVPQKNGSFIIVHSTNTHPHLKPDDRYSAIITHPETPSHSPS